MLIYLVKDKNVFKLVSTTSMKLCVLKQWDVIDEIYLNIITKVGDITLINVDKIIIYISDIIINECVNYVNNKCGVCKRLKLKIDFIKNGVKLKSCLECRLKTKKYKNKIQKINNEYDECVMTGKKIFGAHFCT